MTSKLARRQGPRRPRQRFANQRVRVIVEKIDAKSVRVTLAVVLPKRRLWPDRNAKAKASVLRGLAQARAGKLAKTPPKARGTDHGAPMIVTAGRGVYARPNAATSFGRPSRDESFRMTIEIIPAASKAIPAAPISHFAAPLGGAPGGGHNMPRK